MDFNTSGIRSPFSPRVKQSLTGKRPIGNHSAKKNQNKYENDLQGEVVYKSGNITLETYGPPLPVMVTEALAFANNDVTVRISSCGWCWLVVGRRILAWPLHGTEGAATAAALELTLPQTDLTHKADLVDVFYDEEAQCVSCIGVSPEGVVRYWAAARHAAVFAELALQLSGQECALLQRSSPGHLLATTSCNLLSLHHDNKEGRGSVVGRCLRAGGGWLGGLGRRVSLLFFGAMPQHDNTKLSGMVVVRPGPVLEEAEGAGAAGLCAVAAGGAVQLCDVTARPHLHLAQLLTRHAAGVAGEQAARELTILDMKVADDGDLLLLVAFTAREPRYLIVKLQVSGESPRVVWVQGAGAGGGGEAPRLLPAGGVLLLYTATTIVAYNLWEMGAGGGGGAGVSDPPVVSLARGERAMGGGRGVLLVSRLGALRPRANARPPPPGAPNSPTAHSGLYDSMMDSPNIVDVYTGNLSLLEIDPYEISKVTTDACGKLKTAFLFHLRNDTASCNAILQELFPLPPPPAPDAMQGSPQRGGGAPPGAVRGAAGGGVGGGEREADGVLDRTVYRIALELLDDIPAGDSRWQVARGEGGGGAAGAGARQTVVPLGSSCALGGAAQLRDKRRAFALLAAFLARRALTPRLATVTTEWGVMPTVCALGELAARLCAAAALHDAPPANIEAALNKVVWEGVERGEEEAGVAAALRSGSVSARDAAFRRVSRTWRLLLALAQDPAAVTVLPPVLAEIQKCHMSWAAPGPAPSPPFYPPEFINALLDLLPKVVSVCKNSRMPAAERGATLAALLALADVLLQQAPRRARQVLQALVQSDQAERALLLAEKFRLFDELIDLCVDHFDMERLYTYIDKYIDDGVGARAFAALQKRGGTALSRLVQHAAARPRLAAALSLPTAAPSVSQATAVPPTDPHTLLQLARGQYARAAAALVQRAEAETASLDTAMVAASLGKLCALVCPAEQTGVGGGALQDALRRGERVLVVGEHTRALPQPFTTRYGVDGTVYTPHQLIQMYIEFGGSTLSEVDYKKALDLTHYIDDPDLRDDLRLQVWCAAILADEWSGQTDMDAARAQLRDKKFFRLIDLVQLMGGDLELLLPAPEDLVTARALAPVMEEPGARFLLQYGLEALYYCPSPEPPTHAAAAPALTPAPALAPAH